MATEQYTSESTVGDGASPPPAQPRSTPAHNPTENPHVENPHVFAVRAYETGPLDYGRLSAAIKRVSWGAILAGATVALIVGFLLHLLGLGIGLETFDPATEADDTLGGFGTGQAIWLVISGLISLFLGGWVAGRLAGMPRRADGGLHGLVAWSVTTLLALYFAASGLGALVGGVTNVLGQGLSLVGQGVAAVAPQAADAAQEAVPADLSAEDFRAEVRELLRETGDPALQPENIEAEAAEVTAEAREADLVAAIQTAFDEAGQIVSAADREDLVNVVQANTDLSEAEARQTVAVWEGRFETLAQELSQTARQTGSQLTSATETAVDALGTAALVSFFVLLLGALAAVAGGLVGAPKDLPTTEVHA